MYNLDDVDVIEATQDFNLTENALRVFKYAKHIFDLFDGYTRLVREAVVDSFSNSAVGA